MPNVIQLNKTYVKKEDFFGGYLSLDSGVKRNGVLTVTQSDTYGRVVDVFKFDACADGDRLYFEFPLEKTITLVNFIDVKFAADDGAVYAAPKFEFIVTPDVCELDDYNVVMYYPYANENQNKLRDIGITAGQTQSSRAMPNDESLGKARIWWQNNFRFYVDQIALEYYANYHSPVHDPKDKLLIAAKEQYKANKNDKSAFVRNPSFFDTDALDRAMKRIDSAVSTQKKFKPLIYTTDECGVTDLVTAWDFCFDERTLAAMRVWLLEQYGNLDNLNKEWDTDFATIDDVVPFTTDEIMARDNRNLAPWADHRHFMNKAFADAVVKAREQAHVSDPEAKWGLVGCQMPAPFGGYDYWLLEKSVDVFEPYNIGNNREIIRSINPVKPCITTSFGHSDDEVWRLWHQMLHGDRGIIIYDEENRYMNEDGSPTEMGLRCKPVYNELISGVVKQYTHSSELPSKAAIHYSHASITAFWELEIKRMKANWVNRGSGTDRFDSDFLRLRESAIKLLEDNHAAYKFTAYAELENGAFEKEDIDVLFLPQSIAMSKKEIGAVKRFVNAGGTVVADFSCALMDEHCKELEGGALDDFFGISGSCIWGKPSETSLKPITALPAEFAWAKPIISVPKVSFAPLAQTDITVAADALALFAGEDGSPAVIVKNHGAGRTIYLNIDVTNYHRWRLKDDEGDTIRALYNAILATADIAPYTPLVTAENGDASSLEVFNRRSGDMEIIAVHRNYQLRVSELGPPEYQDMSGLQKAFDVEINLGAKKAVYDLRNGKFLGNTGKVKLNMPVWEPIIITAFDREVKSLTLTAPEKTKKGAIAALNVTVDTLTPADTHIIRFTVNGPDGKEIQYYNANITAPYGKARHSFPLAADAAVGKYQIKVTDRATGVSAVQDIIVE
jgi:Beta-galactosidase./Beta-galactosidase trimerisation domain.